VNHIDLELAILHSSSANYGLTMRFRQPAANLDQRLSATWTLDTAALDQRLHDPAAYGKVLAAQLLADPAARAFLGQALAVAASQRLPLHLRLFIDGGAEALHSLRWETLRLPDSAAPAATSAWVRFSRYLDSADWRPVSLASQGSLVALVAIASPDLTGAALAEIRTDDELAAARAGLAGMRIVALAGRGQVTRENLLARLRDGCDILYLVAHGMMVDDEPHILLEREDGGRAWTSGQELATAFAALARQPSLAVLLSCQSAGTGQDAGALAALGPRLAAAGAPAVVAMQGNVAMDTAAAFMSVFLRELRRDGQVDRAMAVARGAVQERPDWWMPVLFTRLTDGRLWTPSSPDALPEIARQNFEPETIYIPSGSFLMGSPDGAGFPEHECPQREVVLGEYRIGKYPVMNCEYELFLRETQRLARPELRWDGQTPPRGEERHPVSGVTWCDALAYCQWLSGKTKPRRYTLPSEAHWERAARGVDGRLYPWGDWAVGRCHQGQPGLAAVDAYDSQSPAGCYDMVGNVPQWTSTLWGSNVLEPRDPYPWASDGRDDLAANSQMRRIVRGGAAMDPPEKLRCAARASALPLTPGPFGKRHGFRVMMRLDAASPTTPFCQPEG
jgi:formylglycine-generating enzyme required for sulfatase activity